MTVQINKTANTHRGLPVCTVFYILSGTNDWLRSATGRCESHGHDSISRNAPGRALLPPPPPPPSRLPPVLVVSRIVYYCPMVLSRSSVYVCVYIYNIYKPNAGKNAEDNDSFNDALLARRVRKGKATSVILSRGCLPWRIISRTTLLGKWIL